MLLSPPHPIKTSVVGWQKGDVGILQTDSASNGTVCIAALRMGETSARKWASPPSLSLLLGHSIAAAARRRETLVRGHKF